MQGYLLLIVYCSLLEDMEKTYIKLEDLRAYTIASDLCDYVWDIVIQWDWFAKQTIGSQFVRAIDSNASNIAEGFGRHFKKEKIQFFRYSRGSVYESSHWCKKADKRKLITEEQYNHIINELRKLPKEINILIKNTNNLKE